MKRFFAAAIAAGLAFGASSAFAQVADTETFTTTVGTIVQWITAKSNTAGATIDIWDVDEDDQSGATGDKSTAIVVFRLVTNVDVTLTGEFDNGDGSAGDPLRQQTTGELLMTFANITSDGDGTTAATLGGDDHSTGGANTGFLAATYDLNDGVGTAAGDGFNFGYIGGAATTGTPDEPDDDDSTGNNVYAPVSAGEQFLNDATGHTVTHIDHDGAVLLTVRIIGMNAEDYGLDSDTTEAPDPGNYTTALTLTATP